MGTSEWRDLLTALAVTPRQRETETDTSLLEVLTYSLGGREGLNTALLPRLAAPVLPAAAQPAASAGRIERSPAESALDTAIRTAGTVTGIGPLVTGLLRLFAGGRNEEEPVAPLPYSLPEQIAVEAGLADDRSFVPVAYSQRGIAREAGQTREAFDTRAAQVYVNVQAMDSRSFLDHSDEIARAVRDAMLRSHSLNDVVAEI